MGEEEPESHKLMPKYLVTGFVIGSRKIVNEKTNREAFAKLRVATLATLIDSWHIWLVVVD